MFKSLKKFLSASVAAAITVSCLSGCMGGGKTAEKGEDDMSKPYNIVWYFIAGNDTADIDTVETKMNEYLKDKINATVEFAPIDWSAYESKMNTIIASGENYDLCFTSNWILNVEPNINRGSFFAIDELVDKYAPKTKELIGAENLETIKVRSGDADKVGHYYYLPTIKDWAMDYGFVFRKDLVEKYNIDYKNIKSIDALVPALDIIKKNEPGVTPFLIGGTSSPVSLLEVQHTTYPAAFYVGKNYGQPIMVTETPEYKEACLQSRMLVEKGYAPSDAIVANSANGKKNGDYFCWIEQLKPGKAQEYGPEYKHEYVQTDVTTPIMGSLAGSAFAVSRVSKNPARVMKFLELYYTDPYLSNLFAFGIEGKHYTKNPDGRIKLISNSGYSRTGMQWMFGDTTKNLLFENEDPDKNKQLIEFNKNAYRQPYDDMKIDADSIKTQSATCINVRNEFEGLLMAGAVDVEKELARYNEKLRQSGADKIMEMYEKASKEWLESHPEYAAKNK